ncbi:hypothetical protein DFS34DRAFT_174397 [Phlyctochytrium arcticum]|nr:hypothetical protein DFS34DRAFT_174397 [Phlyctochytrium arcticum]
MKRMSFEKRKLVALESREQFYTNKSLIDELVNEIVPLLTEKNITHFIDSSAGDGYLVFKLKQLLPNINYVSYDLYPASDLYSDVIQMDFLKATRDADMTRVAVGFNPPFGSSCMTAVRFIQHAVKEYEPETICMILPHRATVRDFPGMKVAHKRLLPSKSFHKYATKKTPD